QLLVARLSERAPAIREVDAVDLRLTAALRKVEQRRGAQLEVIVRIQVEETLDVADGREVTEGACRRALRQRYSLPLLELVAQSVHGFGGQQDVLIPRIGHQVAQPDARPLQAF